MKPRIAFILTLLLGASAVANHARAQQPRDTTSLTLRFDYDGAVALIAALERPSLTAQDVDSLLRIPGLRAMVDNVTRFYPSVGRQEFRSDIQAFVRTGQEPPHDAHRLFDFADVRRTSPQVRQLIQSIRSREGEIVGRVVARLERYRPNTGPLPLTVYFVVGGVSDGFVPDKSFAPAFYDNLARAEGDLAGVELVMTHEIYHVLQKAAAHRVPGLAAGVDQPEQLPPIQHLFASTLWEGTAMHVADPMRATGTGPYVEMWRDRAKRNSAPERIAENFALFDRVVRDLRAGRLTWQQVDSIGFSGNNDERFYAVGYLMTAAVERYCGAACIPRLLERPPVEFFRQYVALYHEHPEIPGHFSRETEAVIADPR